MAGYENCPGRSCDGGGSVVAAAASAWRLSCQQSTREDGLSAAIIQSRAICVFIFTMYVCI
jgi:hypothetical protein|eukprot:SAG25_NODE_914_length_4782_cov_18.583600_7_plen_61_part_00